jgi:hypothetical protein
MKGSKSVRYFLFWGGVTLAIIFVFYNQVVEGFVPAVKRTYYKKNTDGSCSTMYSCCNIAGPTGTTYKNSSCTTSGSNFYGICTSGQTTCS